MRHVFGQRTASPGGRQACYEKCTLWKIPGGSNRAPHAPSRDNPRCAKMDSRTSVEHYDAFDDVTRVGFDFYPKCRSLRHTSSHEPNR
jgi:hypothetical protein